MTPTRADRRRWIGGGSRVKMASAMGLLGLLVLRPFGLAPAAEQPSLSLLLRGPTNTIRLGDEIPVEFLITNTGLADYKFTDRNYDRSGRMWEYRLTATTATGAKVPDPRRQFRPGMMGGLGQARSLLPGQSFTKTIALNLWALIEAPGRYEVVGDYGEDAAALRSAPITIVVLPRTQQEMADYINGLTNQVAAQFAPAKGSSAGVSPDLVMRLMYTGSPKIVPALLQVLVQTNTPRGNAQFWATAALADYVPHNREFQAAILGAAGSYGLNDTGLDQLLLGEGFDPPLVKPILARALAADNPGGWRAGVWLALRYYDDALTPRLISIAEDAGARIDTRSLALRALTFHRSDAGVSAIKALLKDPAPEMLRPLFETIANGYPAPDVAQTQGRLQPGDLSAEDLRPLIERLLVSSNQALQLPLSGVILAKRFGSDALNAPLIALTASPASEVRGGAIEALALNRTDEGVKRLQELLHHPDVNLAQMATTAIRNAYLARGDALGRPLRPEDFPAEFRQPAAGPAK